MAISGVFDIGKSALFAAQQALNTTAHNVANSSTPGYSRQTIQLSNIPSGIFSTTGVSGRGVTVAGVKRMYDSFLNLQMNTEQSNQAYLNAYNDGIQPLQDIFNDASKTGLGSSITAFFNSWQSVSQYPNEPAQRATLLADANTLASRINSAYTTLENTSSSLYKSSEDLVNQVNKLTAQISSLNTSIVASPGALDLQDKRDTVISQLNSIVKVNTFEDPSGRVSVMLGGTPLVDGGKTFTMGMNAVSGDKMQFYIITDSAVDITKQPDVTSFIYGGQLKANIDLRDGQLKDLMSQLNAFAYDMIKTVNYYNQSGYGLDGSTGNSFFKDLPLDFQFTDSNLNGGGNVTGATITDLNRADFSKQYSIDYFISGGTGYQQEESSGIYWRVQESTDSGNTWSVVDPAQVNIGVSKILVNASNNQIRLTEGGVTATATITAGEYTRDQLASAVKSALQTATVSANTYTVTYDPATSHFIIKSDAGNADNLSLLWSDALTTAETALGFAAVDTNGIVAGGTDSSDNNVSSPSFRTLDFNGIQVTISGTQAVLLSEKAETFGVNSYNQAAKSMSVAITDPNKIAAASGDTSMTSTDSVYVDGTNNKVTVSIDGGVNWNVITLDNNRYDWTSLAAQLQTKMNASGANVTVGYDTTNRQFTITNNAAANTVILDWTDRSATTAEDLFGFKTNSVIAPSGSDTSDFQAGVGQIVIDGSNNTIRFSEDGGVTYISATIAQGVYTRTRLAEKVAEAFDKASGHNYNYTVNFDAAKSAFTIVNSGASTNPNTMVIDWTDPATTAEGVLGFNSTARSVVASSNGYVSSDMETTGGSITVDYTNNTVRFSEDGGTTYKTTSIPDGTYTRMELADMLQIALEDSDTATNYNYAVTYNPTLRQYTVNNDGANTNPNRMIIDWTDTASTAAGLYGFKSTSMVDSRSSVSGNPTLYPMLPGDNMNAKLIAGLADKGFMSGNNIPIAYYSTMVSNVGTAAGAAQTKLDFQNSLVDSLKTRQQQISGVSLDEEAVNVIQYQRSYQAAAKLINVAESLFQTLLSIGGTQ
jgi:flagellar hook-associated protein 1 FlgK